MGYRNARGFGSPIARVPAIALVLVVSVLSGGADAGEARVITRTISPAATISVIKVYRGVALAMAYVTNKGSVVSAIVDSANPAPGFREVRAGGLTIDPVRLLLDDDTLRPGDVVALPDGLKVFTGVEGAPHSAKDFVSLAARPGLLGSNLRGLMALDRISRASLKDGRPPAVAATASFRETVASRANTFAAEARTELRSTR